MKTTLRTATAWLSATIALASIVSCSATALRKPSSVASSGFPRDLIAATHRFRAHIASDAFSPSSCAEDLRRIRDSLSPQTHDDFDWRLVSSQADQILRNLWQTRLELRQKLLSWGSGASEDCANAVRDVFLASRFVEEYVAVRKPNPTPADAKTIMRPYTGGFPYLMQADGTGPVEFRSGDVLISRGTAPTSAAIARIGDRDGVFSHLALLYIDEKTGRKYTIEAHIEVGVVVLPFEEYFKDGKARSVLYRFDDPVLAHQAAKLMYDRASAAIAAGANIPYDFAFDPDDDREVFCAEVMREGFRKASGGSVVSPLFPSKITMRNRDFLNAIGMSVTSTFAPMDMELEPRFRMLAEWRDLGRIEDNRRMDAILVKMFDWMDSYDYVLFNDQTNRFYSNVLHELRRAPLFEKLLADQFPVNMKTETIEATFALKWASLALEKQLIKRQDAYLERTGFRMTFAEELAALDDLRSGDLARWRRWKPWYERNKNTSRKERDREPPRPVFHQWFHARADGPLN